MKKRLAAWALALGLGLTCLSAGAEGAFSDVPAGAWYAEAAEYVAGLGMMQGFGDGGFHPEEPCSRAMLVTVLYRQAGRPGVGGGPAFEDVPLGGWYYDAVAWAYETGVVKGYSDSVFGAEDPVTREQLAVILWRQAGSPAPQGYTAFRDGELIADYAVDAVTWAGEQGLMNGTGTHEFLPKDNATRGEIAQILYRQNGGADIPMLAN